MKPSLIAFTMAVSSLLQASETFNGEIDAHGLVRAFKAVSPASVAYPPVGPYQFAVVRRSQVVDVIATTRNTMGKTYGTSVNIQTASTGWNQRFDCEAIAMAFALELRARLMRELWHSYSHATRPACFIVGYRPVPTVAKGHAVVFVATDEGGLFVDPVSGLGS